MQPRQNQRLGTCQPDAAPDDGFALLDQELRFREVNAALAVIHGLPVEAHLGRTVGDVLPQLATTLEPLLLQVFASGEPVIDVELRGTLTLEGPPERRLTSFYPVRSRGGSVVAVDMLVRALPALPWPVDSPESLAAMRERERFAAAVAEASPSLIYVYDLAANRNRYANGRLEELYGYTRAEIDAMGPGFLFRLLHPDDVPAALAHIADLQQAADGQILQVVYRFRHKDGSWHWLRSREVPFARDAAGGVSEVLGVAEDITAQQEGESIAHLATKAALEAAQAATRERDLLISIAAHDLRTPLTAILGQAQLLQRRLAREGHDERTQRSAAAIAEQAERLNQMIAALLDLSRIQEGRLTISPEPVELQPLLERVVAGVQATTSEHRIAFTPPPAATIVPGDPLRLEQIFVNLLSNAVKYSPRGGTIQLWTEDDDGQLCVRLRDQGIGIPDEALPHLFTRFYRAPNAAGQQSSSLGIGLFIVRELVQAHAGSIAVESELGCGSMFSVCLPLVCPLPARA